LKAADTKPVSIKLNSGKFLPTETQRKREIRELNDNIINLTSEIIGCAIEVHKVCGPGLLEGIYKQCLVYELKKSEHIVDVEKLFTYTYKESNIKFDFRIDLVIDNAVIIELKSVSALNSLHGAQLMTYMRLSNINTGLLINFNVPYLKEGIQRFVL
jgi:GxxExxY protein